MERPQTQARHDLTYLDGAARADLWLLGEDAAPLIEGAGDRTGSWAPTWSPDGSRFTYLSVHDAGVRLFLGSRSGPVRALTGRDRDVDLMAGGGNGNGSPVVWVDDNTIVVPLLPPGTRTSRYALEHRGQTGAVDRWRRSAADEVSVSVVDGGPLASTDLPRSELVRIDVRTGARTSLYQGPFIRLLPSPQADQAALILATEEHSLPARLDGAPRWRDRAVLIDLETGDTTGLPGIEGVGGGAGAAPPVHAWSPDGRWWGVGFGESGQERRVAIVDLRDGHVRRPAIPASVGSLLWSPGNELLVHSGGQWARIDPSTSVVQMLPGEPAAPSELFVVGDRLVGLSGGDLWLIDPDGSRRNLTAAYEPRLLILRQAGSGENGVFISAVPGDGSPIPEYVGVTVDAEGEVADLVPLPRPGHLARIVDLDLDRDRALWIGATSEGTFLWRTDARGRQPEVQIHLNEHLQEVQEAERVVLDYTSMDGEPLQALLLLPPGYDGEDPLPTVVYVYPNTTIRSGTGWQLNNDYTFNVQLLAALGYAVLTPSTPLRAHEGRTDEHLEIAKGVLPAIDAAARAGYTDDDRLAVIGHSWGGFAVYSLLTTTPRFQAAIASAGYASPFARYGTFPPRARYHEDALETIFGHRNYENRFGGPPVEALWHYLRNSPLHFMDRVTTPLLIVQGDQDYIPVQQGEQVFTTLHRAGKPVRFVRYYGEEHVVENPAHIRDLWTRIESWLDCYLRTAGCTEAPTHVVSGR